MSLSVLRSPPSIASIAADRQATAEDGSEHSGLVRLCLGGDPAQWGGATGIFKYGLVDAKVGALIRKGKERNR